MSIKWWSKVLSDKYLAAFFLLIARDRYIYCLCIYLESFLLQTILKEQIVLFCPVFRKLGLLLLQTN